jgi:hypothetical protein
MNCLKFVERRVLEVFTHFFEKRKDVWTFKLSNVSPNFKWNSANKKYLLHFQPFTLKHNDYDCVSQKKKKKIMIVWSFLFTFTKSFYTKNTVNCFFVLIERNATGEFSLTHHLWHHFVGNESLSNSRKKSAIVLLSLSLFKRQKQKAYRILQIFTLPRKDFFLDFVSFVKK